MAACISKSDKGPRSFKTLSCNYRRSNFHYLTSRETVELRVKCLMLKLGLISHWLPTQICQQHAWTDHPRAQIWFKGLCQTKNLPSNNQDIRSDDSLASGSLHPFLIETVEWKRQRGAKISQKPRRSSFPKPTELQLNLYQYKVCVCSCACQILQVPKHAL